MIFSFLFLVISYPKLTITYPRKLNIKYVKY